MATLYDVQTYIDDPLGGTLVEGPRYASVLFRRVRGGIDERGGHGRAVEVELEPARGIPAGPLVLKACGDARYVAEEARVMGGQHRNPFLPELAATCALRDGTPCLLMSRAPGRTLRELMDAGGLASLAPAPPAEGPLAEEARDAARRMREEGRLPVATAVRAVGLPLAEGLAELEGHEFCHGDVSPGNVLVGGDGAVSMVDLGCLTSLGEQPRGRGTGPYVLPGWEDGPGGRPGNCRGIDAYALAVLLRELVDPAGDGELVPPAAECAEALGGGWRRRPRSLFRGCSEEEVERAFLDVASRLDRRFADGLRGFSGQVAQAAAARRTAGEGRQGDRRGRDDCDDHGDGRFSEELEEAASLHARYWEANVRSVLEAAASMNVPLLSICSQVGVPDAPVETYPSSLGAIVDYLVGTGRLQWLARDAWRPRGGGSAALSVYHDALLGFFSGELGKDEALGALDEAEGLAARDGDRELRFEVLLRRAHVAWSDEDADAAAESAASLLRAIGICETEDERRVAGDMAVSMARRMSARGLNHNIMIAVDNRQNAEISESA